MFGRGSFCESSEDPSVPLVEAILDERGIRLDATVPPREERPAATHAMWICACVTLEDAPTWLIYDADDRVLWCRIPDGAEAEDVVDAQFMAGGHTDPDGVLAWLRGDEPDPWGGNGRGDACVVTELGRLIGRA